MMKPTVVFFQIMVLISFATCNTDRQDDFEVSSPHNKISLQFGLFDGKPFYKVMKGDTLVLDTSWLGFELKDQPALRDNFTLKDMQKVSFDETWEQPWGEKRFIRNNYSQIKIKLQQNDADARQLNIVFRVFDDGIGFRYEFPEQLNLHQFVIMDEITEFNLADVHDAWWIPAYRDNRYEYLYEKTKVNQMDTVHTPLTLETTNGLYLSIHEAALTNYSSMTLFCTDNKILHADLVPWSNGDKVRAVTPLETPWRTVQIAEKPGDLITSYLILNLNEPNKLGDVSSWVYTGKYIGVWWGMHIDIETWGSGPKHGANTQNVMNYIDFASKYGFKGVLVEGWNQGWDGDWAANGDIFNFTQPYPDFDIEKLSEYAKEKGVKLIGHHETGASTINYEDQMEDAYNFYNKYGVDVIKTGYVGSRLDKKEWHHGQYGVNHYQKVIEEAAKHHIMIVAHEPIKATGKRRTYPNMMSREGCRGQEYDAWSPDGGNPPSHTCIIPFTRLLGGPFDFTPGTFDISIPTKPNNQVNTTLAKQLAVYITNYAPFQMASDLPKNYLNNLPAFQFILDVVTDWEDTRVLNAQIGEYITVARKDRNSADWFLGSITNEKAREFSISLNFLDNGKYRAEIYADGNEANYITNPLAIEIFQKEVSKTDTLQVKLALGGGQAIRFKKI